MSGHFAALANDLTAGALRQDAFARTFGGYPNRFTPTAAGSRRATQRAGAQREAALVVSALAAHHATRAAGLPSRAPAGAAPYWAVRSLCARRAE